MKLTRLIGLSVAIFAMAQTGYASETVLGYTFDSCTRFSNGEINYCTRNGESWFWFKPQQFVKFLHLSGNRWRLCNSSPDYVADFKAPVSILLDAEVNCSTRTIEFLKVISYKNGFCEGPQVETTNFKRGQKVHPVVSQTNYFGALEHLACKRKQGTSQPKLKKKPVENQGIPIQVEETFGPPEPPADWYKDPPDYCKDFDTFVKDCESGDSEACYFAGMAYKPHVYSYNLRRGHNDRKIEGEASYCPKVEADKQKALEYFTKACDGSDGWGCLELGKDKEAQNNWRESLTYYEKGCKSKDPCGIACRKAADFYISGNLVREDQKKASDFLERGCATKDATSCLNLAKLCEAEKATWLKFIAKSKAKKYYGLACDYGDSDGCYNYKRMYSE